MQSILAIFGFLLILAILWDAFETIILPRRVTRRLRLTTLFYRTTWKPWGYIARHMTDGRRREKYLALFGPLSLLALLVAWATGLIFGYALLQWALQTKLNLSQQTVAFDDYLYLSAVSFFTLGFGDLVPTTNVGRLLVSIEAGNGFGLLAIVIGYLPVLYQSFSRREVNISLLDARAGSPSSAAELLRRQSNSNSLQELDVLLRGWEHWSAELMESHLSYPVLCYFRSQHDNQSWLAALTTVLDTCALVMVGVDGAPAWQARLTFAIARHAVVDIAQIFERAPSTVQCCDARLSEAQLATLRKMLVTNGILIREGSDADRRLLQFREMYEPYVFALSDWLMMPLPPWILPESAIDNWKTSAWGRIQ
jgi:ion channel